MSVTDDLEAAGAELAPVLGALYRRIRQTKSLGELTAPESSALSRLDHHGPITAAELAKLERISPQSIAATLRGLVDRDLVTRSADPDDGRRIILSLTATGRDLVHSRRAARSEQLQRALAALPAEQRRQLLAALPALSALARELS